MQYGIEIGTVLTKFETAKSLLKVYPVRSNAGDAHHCSDPSESAGNLANWSGLQAGCAKLRL